LSKKRYFFLFLADFCENFKNWGKNAKKYIASIHLLRKKSKRKGVKIVKSIYTVIAVLIFIISQK
jgi:hypothetical protein